VRNSLILMSLLLLTACGPLVKIGESGPPPQRFTLTLATQSGPTHALPLLRVEDFEAPAELASSRMAIQVGAQEVRYLAGMQWTDRPARLMRGLIADSLRQSSTAPVLVTGQADVTTGLRISGRLTRFHALAPTGLATEVSVGLELMLLKGSSIAASRRFSVTEPSSSDRPADLAAAFNRATGRITTEATNWIVETQAK
jgi:cholesterol transport system auxiliary component